MTFASCLDWMICSEFLFLERWCKYILLWSNSIWWRLPAFFSDIRHSFTYSFIPFLESSRSRIYSFLSYHVLVSWMQPFRRYGPLGIFARLGNDPHAGPFSPLLWWVRDLFQWNINLYWHFPSTPFVLILQSSKLKWESGSSCTFTPLIQVFQSSKLKW